MTSLLYRCMDSHDPTSRSKLLMWVECTQVFPPVSASPVFCIGEGGSGASSLCNGVLLPPGLDESQTGFVEVVSQL